MQEVFYKDDLGLGNFSELKQQIIKALEKTDFLHVRSLQAELGSISRGQLMCALDSMERERFVEIRKAKQDIYVSLA